MLVFVAPVKRSAAEALARTSVKYWDVPSATSDVVRASACAIAAACAALAFEVASAEAVDTAALALDVASAEAVASAADCAASASALANAVVAI